METCDRRGQAKTVQSDGRERGLGLAGAGQGPMVTESWEASACAGQENVFQDAG